MTQGVQPLRIEELRLTDFRAFPGSATFAFKFSGKNLLIYGENGSGKSSVFYALKDFFALKPSRPLGEYKNIFSEEPDTDCKIEVTFNQGLPAVWTQQQHPCELGLGSDRRVVEAALRRICLDYRALLDTNYRQGNGEVDLFEIAVALLVHDFPVPVLGGIPKTIGELWADVETAKPIRRSKRALEKVDDACVQFNQGFNQAIQRLHPYVDTLLTTLLCQDVQVSPFNFAGVTYSRAKKLLEGQRLQLDVLFQKIPIAVHQNFLNEARLSALALAIYLAGRLACVPQTAGSALKLLVLDDVLIGLDHANRLPVLDLLQKYFGDWQTVLLTHDHVWFEMSRNYLSNTAQWEVAEVYESTDSRGILAPFIRMAGVNTADSLLTQARQFLNDHHLPAAANYTRTAFEFVLKEFCEKKSVPVLFKMDHRKLTMENLLNSVEKQFTEKNKYNEIATSVTDVKLWRKIVLNPYSHASPPNITKPEVTRAIAAIESFKQALRASTL